jgi:arylsulfatase A-like enzyme
VPEVAADGSLPNQGRRVLHRAGKILERRGERPLFLFLHFYDVHTDFVVPPEYRERFVRPYDGPMDGSTSQLASIREREAELDEADVRHLFDLYDAEIRQLDDLLAGFLDELDRGGLLENTLVAVVSDHGEEFMEHGSVLHGRTYYQEVLRVPWILAGPGVPRGQRVELPVHLVDVMPTLLELAAVPPPAGQDALDGVSLAPLLAGGPAPDDRLLFAEADHHNAEPDIRRLVRTPRYKLVYDRLVERAELFDLESDPAELRDLLDEEPELAELLMERLRAFMAGEREADAIEGPDADTLEALRKLGY